MARKTTLTEVSRQLFALSGNQCAFPGCEHKLINKKGQFVGQVCHIEAANKGGERYNELQTDEERRSFPNLMLMCYQHHIETDDIDEFSVAKLKDIKVAHEARYEKEQYSIPNDFSYRILSDVAEKIDDILEIVTDTNAGVHELLGIFKGNSKLFIPTLEVQHIYIAQLESITELKKQNKHDTAIQLLYDYKKNNWSSLSEELKYRVLANLGLCYFEMGQSQKAAESLIELEEVDFESENSIAFLCIATSLLKKKEQFDKYFEKGKKLNIKNENLWVAFIYNELVDLPDEEFDKILPDEVLNNINILYALGERFIVRGSTDLGMSKLEKALETISSEDKNDSLLEASIACKMLTAVISPFKFHYNQFTPPEIEQIHTAIRLLSKYWNSIKDSELAKANYYVVMDRGIALKAIGQFENALLDLEKAYELSHNITAFQNLCATYIEQGKAEKAKVLIESPDTADFKVLNAFEFTILKARILLYEKSYEEAVQCLLNLKETLSDKQQTFYLNIVVSIYLDAKNFGQALHFVQELLVKQPNMIAGHVNEGYCYEKLSQPHVAIQSYDRAYELIEENSPSEELLNLGIGYLELKNYDKAISVLKRVCDPLVLNHSSKKLLQAYKQTGDTQNLIELGESLFSRYPTDSILTELLFDTYYELGKYDKAKEIINRLLSSEAANKEYFFMKGAFLYDRLRDYIGLKQMVDKIEDPYQFDVISVYRIAFWHRKTGNFMKALDIAFKARELHYEEAKTHENYVQFIYMADDVASNVVHPNKVEPESVIILTDVNGTEYRYIVSDKNLKDVSNIKIESTLGALLMGKTVGETIHVEKESGYKQELHIKFIVNKYVFGLNESLRLLTTKFALDTKTTVFHSEPVNQIEELKQFVKNTSLEHEDNKKLLHSYYNQGKATIEAIAKIEGINLVKKWFQLLSAEDISILCCTDDESLTMERAFGQNSPVIIDLLSLLTIFFLGGKMELHKHLTMPIVISQSTIDVINAFIQELENNGDRGYSTFGFSNGNYFFNEVGQDVIQLHKDTLSSIVKWAYINATVKSPEGKLKVNKSERDKLTKIIGDCAYDNILLAQEYKGVVLSDDANYKRFIQSKYQLASFSTYELAVYLHLASSINLETINAFSVNLIVHNYKYITTNSSVIWSVFEAGQFKISHPFRNAVQSLLLRLPKVLSAIVSKFFKQLFLNPGLALTRQQIVYFVIQEIRNRYLHFEVFKSEISNSIRKEFELLQKQADELLFLLTPFL